MTHVTAMIFAAGLGTRLYPLTADRPKALVEIAGKPLLQHAIEKLVSEGFHDIVVNVHHYAEKMKDFLQTHHFDAHISISDESALLLDTAGGLKFAEPFFSDSDHILLYNVDILSDISLQRLCEWHIQSGTLATLAVRERPTSRYFLFDEATLQLCGWQNVSSGERVLSRPTDHEKLWAFSGIHVVSRTILDFIPPHEKLSMTPLYLQLAREHTLLGYLHQSDSWRDVGKYEDWKSQM